MDEEGLIEGYFEIKKVKPQSRLTERERKRVRDSFCTCV